MEALVNNTSAGIIKGFQVTRQDKEHLVEAKRTQSTACGIKAIPHTIRIHIFFHASRHDLEKEERKG